MTIPASGSISTSLINVELRKQDTATISLNDTDIRRLAGIQTNASQISFSDFRNKSSGINVIWSGNLSSGGAYNIAIPTNATNTLLFPANSSLTFQLTFHSNLPAGHWTWSYLYSWLELAPVTSYNANGTPNWGTWQYPYWVGAGVFTGGFHWPPSALIQANTYGQNFLVAEGYRKGAPAYYGGQGITTAVISSLPPTGYDGGYNGGAIGYGYPMGNTQTVVFTNNSSTSYVLWLYPGYDGTKTPINLAFYSTNVGQSNGAVWVGQVSNTHTARLVGNGTAPLVTSLVINGTVVTATVQLGATTSTLVAAFKTAINNAGIAGVSAADVSTQSGIGLTVAGANSITYSNVQNLGWSNDIPIIGN